MQVPSQAPMATPTNAATPAAQMNSPIVPMAHQHAASSAPAASPVPPHLAGGQPSSATAFRPPEKPAPRVETGEPDDAASFNTVERFHPTLGQRLKRNAVGLVFLLLFVGGGAAFLIANKSLFEGKERKEVAHDEVSPRRGPVTDASKQNKAQKLYGIKVKVKRVEYGEVLAKDVNSTIQSSGDSAFLQIYVHLENQGDEDRPYKSWYGNVFNVEERRLVAQLSDNEKREYQMMTFGDVTGVKGNTPEGVLSTTSEGGLTRELDDVIIFELPPDVDPDALRYFRLTLPAAAFGGNGTFRFKIPVEMINAEPDFPDFGSEEIGETGS